MSDYNWKKQNTVFVGLRFFKTTDADILSALEGKNKQGFIKAALRYYIANGCPDVEKKETDNE